MTAPTVGKVVAKTTLSHTAGGGVSCYNHSGKLSAVPTKPETVYDLTVFFLGV